ncbi:hypothetical protein JL100_016265 [Skermanella mucosa]|uniref:hypothetical protein n=1 Tax=Skermanella mucosa TaxID=1789672 RepID=UPI00192C5F3B|nr:hypothetical protein [Skermanella mucosa]UEM18671.1 hypothetical protein JL100_016265 [Skermanella mucosa]
MILLNHWLTEARDLFVAKIHFNLDAEVNWAVQGSTLAVQQLHFCPYRYLYAAEEPELIAPEPARK